MVMVVAMTTLSLRAQTSGEMLKSFADKWSAKKQMEMKELTRIGIVLTDDDDFTITLDPSGSATVTAGLMDQYYYHYALDKGMLKKIYSRELNALTAMGAAKESDKTPLDVGFQEGKSPDENFMPFFLSFSFHFWNGDWPEKIQFGEQHARMVHGGLATVFYYQKGLRTAWYKLKSGMHSNKNPDDQKNEFPSLFIITKGSGKAKFDGRTANLKEGETYFIPAGMSHEFWCEKTEMECIMIAFGEGA
jgi:mannose-6-phosphate isomerase-like protein (cupin superfamily)